MAAAGIVEKDQPRYAANEKHTTMANSPESLSEDLFRAIDSKNNQFDIDDMKRLGKRQEFKRNFSFLSTMGFISVYMATWEIAILVLSAGLYSASLAEMESMAPTSGEQYHWVSEFAPPSYQKILSYASGWMSSLAWLASQTSGPFLTTTLIQVMIYVTKPDDAFKSWQYTLMMLGWISSTIFFNTSAAKALPMMETAALFIHVIGFLVVIIPLWVLCPKNSTKDVFTLFINKSGYSNMATAELLIQVTSPPNLFGLPKAQSIIHISEKVEDAGLVVPTCTLWGLYIINFVLALITIVTMLLFGPINDEINAEIPYLLLITNMNNSGVAIFSLVIPFILIYIGNITLLATVSRERWAFSRV